FLMRLSLGYPDEQAEHDMLMGRDRRELIENAPALIDADVLRSLRRAVPRIHASEALVAYVQRLLAATRHHAQIQVGLSPRAGLALLRAARALALLHGRAHALPEDVQAVFVEVAAHRLTPRQGNGDRAALAKAVLHGVAIDSGAPGALPRAALGAGGKTPARADAPAPQRGAADRTAPPPHLRAAHALRPVLRAAAVRDDARLAELQQQPGADPVLPVAV